jgi:DNA replication protein
MTAGGGPFSGFPAGARATAIPNAFFSEVLPAIDDPIELAVSVYVFYALGRRRAGERWITAGELAQEMPLRRMLQRLGVDGAEAVTSGLNAGVRRGTLIVDERGEAARYTLNGPSGRRAFSVAAGPVSGVIDGRGLDPPNIYGLYEETIGTISPLIADELRAAEEEYPAPWIEAAFREAAVHNRRSWRYVARILERWRDEGRQDATVGRDPGTGRDLAGRYRGLIRR